MSLSLNSKGRQFFYANLGELQDALTVAGDSGAAIKIWLAVTYRARVTRSSVVKVTTALCRKFGINDRKAKTRGIARWSQLGHWKVTSANGKNPVVEIVSAGTRHGEAAT
jgi:hypothetical protein